MQTTASFSSFAPEPPPALVDHPEQRLLDGLMADDEAAWREFNALYSRLIYRCITRVTSRFRAVVGPEDVREIYATLCLNLLAHDKKKLRSFEPQRGNKLSSWLGMLAVHTAYDYLRSVRREPRRGCLTEAEALTADQPHPDEALLLRERSELVSGLVSDFSDKDQLFIRLYFGEGLEPEQIARQMRISIKTVYSKKHKIQTRLEALVDQQRRAA